MRGLMTAVSGIDGIPPSAVAESFATRRRRESRHEEFAEQARLVEMLKELLDPRTFFSSLENRPRSRLAGVFQRRRHVRAGLPDLMVLHNAKAVFIELKSKRGVPSAAQKQICAELRAAGADWYLARSALAALTALHHSGVTFRRPWSLPTLQAWEGPFTFTNPNERLPQHPEVSVERTAARRRWRERHHARKAAQLAAERDDVAGDNITA